MKVILQEKKVDIAIHWKVDEVMKKVLELMQLQMPKKYEDEDKGLQLKNDYHRIDISYRHNSLGIEIFTGEV